MRSLKLLIGLSGLAGLVFAACNPGDFNSILDHAPVTIADTGGSSTGSLFVLPLPPQTGSTVAARALVTRSDKPYVATADYDMNGKVTLHEDTAAESSLGPGGAVYSSAIRSDGTIILGVPGYPGDQTPTGRVSTATTTTAADGSVKFVLTPGPTGSAGDHLGISVAAGNITGLPGGDFVVLSDSTVQLLPPSGTVPPALGCPSVALKAPPPGGTYGFRPIAVGNLLDDYSGDEVVLGGQIANQGMVVFLHYDPLNSTLSCTPTKVFAGGVSAGFGSSLAIADFDGDGRLDLAVGAPPDRVLVYFGPLDSVTDPQVTISSATASGFGNRIAPLQTSGMGSAELMVADPGARGNKGEIRIFNVTRAATSAIATLFDANQDSDSGGFGQSLGALSFEGGLCPPTTGSKLQAVPFVSVGPELLTFFTYSVGSVATPDPRCFAQPK
jgi:hypothetical protein